MIETANAVSDQKVTADETPPILEIGGQGVYIPYQHIWAHERVNVQQ